MEEAIEKLQKEFSKGTYNRDNKLAFAMGYLQENEKVKRSEAIEILFKIFQNKI